MAKLSLVTGTTSKLLHVFVQNNSVTTGAGLTGLTSSTSGLVAYYVREGAGSSTAITLSAGTLGTWSSGGFVAVDATNMPGLYELGIPNAALASSAASVTVMLQGAANMAPVLLEIELTAVNNQSTGFGLVNASANVVQWNSSNVASPATAGVPDINVKNINNISTSSVATINANIGETQPINFTGTGTSALVKSDMQDIAGSAVSTSTAQIGVNVVNIAGTASAGVAGYVGLDWSHINAPTTTQGLTGTTISTSQQIASVSGAVGSVTGNVGGNVVGSVASVTGNVGGNVTGSVGSVVSTVSANVTQWDGTAVTSTVSPDAVFIRSGTAQGGGATTITLDSGASATNNLYQNEVIFIRSGTGAGQANIISSYVGSTKVATVSNAWATNPDNTSVFSILAAGPVIASVSGTVTANVTQWLGNAVTSATSGIPDVNTKNIGGSASTGAAGYVGIDWGHVNAPTTTVGLTNTTISTTQSVASVSGAVGSVTGNVGGSVASVSGNVAGSVGSVTGSVGSVASTVSANVTQWDSTAVSSTVPPDAIFIRSGVAQAGGSTTITLDAGASATNNLYQNEVIFIRSGTGAGQSNIISSYVGATKVATVGSAWAVNPDNTSTFSIMSFGPVIAAVSGTVNANVTQWNGSAVAVPNVAGVPKVDVIDWLGTAVTAATAGIPDVNTKNYNNVTATTDANNFPKVDVVDIGGSASVGTAGYVGVDWGHVNAPTTTVNLSGTTISTSQSIASVSGSVGSVTGTVTANTTQLAGQTVTAAAGVTFPTSVASPTNITGGTITTVTNLTNAPTSGDFTAAMKTSLNASTPASITGSVGSVTGNVGGNVTGSVGSVVGAVGSVTGNVGGNVTGSVGSVVGSVGSVTGAVTVGAINASASNIKKNTAIGGFQFVMTDATTHAPKTGLSITSTVSLNGGAFGSTTNSATEISNGWYTINLSAADLNGNTVALRFSATGADDRDITWVTQP